MQAQTQLLSRVNISPRGNKKAKAKQTKRRPFTIQTQRDMLQPVIENASSLNLLYAERTDAGRLYSTEWSVCIRNMGMEEIDRTTHLTTSCFVTAAMLRWLTAVAAGRDDGDMFWEPCDRPTGPLWQAFVDADKGAGDEGEWFEGEHCWTVADDRTVYQSYWRRAGLFVLELDRPAQEIFAMLRSLRKEEVAEAWTQLTGGIAPPFCAGRMRCCFAQPSGEVDAVRVASVVAQLVEKISVIPGSVGG
jgi:hypothetical protein